MLNFNEISNDIYSNTNILNNINDSDKMVNDINNININIKNDDIKKDDIYFIDDDINYGNFNIYNNNITGIDIINYLIKNINTSIDISSDKILIINKYILTIINDKNKINIILVNENISEFMNDVAILINLYNQIIKYDKNITDDKIKKTINYFIFLLITQILKLIQKILILNIDDNDKNMYKQYNNILILKHREYINNEIKTNEININKIYDKLKTLINIEQTLNNKIDNLILDIKQQNDELKKMDIGKNSLIIASKYNETTE